MNKLIPRVFPYPTNSLQIFMILNCCTFEQQYCRIIEHQIYSDLLFKNYTTYKKTLSTKTVEFVENYNILKIYTFSLENMFFM